MPCPGKRLRVFHVEDSAPLRRRIQKEMECVDGIEVVGSAAGAGDAMVQIRRFQPDIVIVDLELSEGSGADVLRELRRERGAAVSIVLTNHADALSRDFSMRAGAHYFFDKSVHFDEFLTLMRTLCQ